MEQRRRTASKFFPIANPAMNLDFRNSNLPPQVTFSRASTATFVGSNGLLQTAAANQPRFAFDPLTLAAKNLMLECEAFTQLALQNTDLTNAAWASVGTITVTGGQADPFGGTGATLLNDTDAAAFATRAQNINTVSSANTYVASVLLKQGSAAASTVRMVFGGGVAVNYDVQITWATLAITAAGSATANDIFIEPATNNGYYKVSVRGADNASGNTFVQIAIFPAGSSAVGNTGSCTVGAVNIGVGSVPQSHVPTAGVAATRQADVCTVSGANLLQLLNPWGGTLAISGSRSVAGASTGVMVGLAETGNFNNSIYVANTAGAGNAVGVNVFKSGVGQATLTQSPANITNRFRLATTWAPNNFASSVDAQAPTVDSAGSVPTPLQVLAIGGAPWAPTTNGWFGFFDYARLWQQDCDPKMLAFLSGSQYN